LRIIQGQQANRRGPGPGGRQRGFTLIELLITLVIAAIMLAIAAPMFEEGLQRNRRLSGLESTTGMIALARSEAVSRSTTIVLCPTVDTNACEGNEWETGVLMFQDSNADQVLDGDEEILRLFRAADEFVTIRSHGSFTDDDRIVFDQFGAVEDFGTLVVCDRGELDTAAGVVINASGQARLATDDDDTDVINLDNNADLGGCP